MHPLLLILLALAEPADVVVVGTPAPEADPRGGAARVQVLAPAEHAGPLLDAGDLLDAAVGAHVRRTGGAGRAQYVQIRGAGGHQVAVFLDGAPLGGGRGAAVDLSALPIGAVDEVAVIRGAAAAAWGSGAQGGVLDVRTRAPRLGHASSARLRLGSARLAQLDGGLSWGGDGAGALGLVSLSAAEGGFPYVDVNGAPRRRQNNAHWQLNALARGHLDVRRHRLSVVLDGVGGARGEPGDEQHPSADASSVRRGGGATARWVGPGWLDGAVQADALVYGRTHRFLLDDPEPFFDAPSRFTLVDHAAGARGGANARVGDHRLGAVAELGWRGARTEALGGSAVTGPAARAEDRLTGALVLSERWQPTAGVRLTGVLRVDAADFRALEWVPNAGVEVRLARHLWWASNLGRAFRDPGFDELFFVGPGIRGNPDLRAEDGWGWDTGLQYSRRWGLLEAVLFGQRYDRLILWVPEGAYRIRARDDFAADVLGVEGRAAVWLGPVDASLAYTWLDARAEAPDAPLPFRPAHRVHATLAARVGGEGRVFGRWDWRSETTVDRFGARTLPAYGLLDVGVDGALGAGLSAGCEVRNLLDAQGLDAVQQPRPGRTLVFSLAWRGR